MFVAGIFWALCDCNSVLSGILCLNGELIATIYDLLINLDMYELRSKVAITTVVIRLYINY